MSLTMRFRLLVLGLFAVAAPRPALAGPVKYLASEISGGLVEPLEPVLANTIGQVGTVAGNLIDKTSTDVGKRLDQTNGILEQRILQIKTSANDVVDNGLDKINGDARARIDQVNKDLQGTISHVSKETAKLLNQANDVLTTQVDNVGRVVNGAIDDANSAVEARLQQADEIAGRRLADVDVVATKQRLGLEKTITRTAWVIALIVFVVTLLKALWKEYEDNTDDIQAKAAAGASRAHEYVSVLAPSLLKHAAVGAIIAAVLAIVPQILPMTAEKDQQTLIAQHMGELERSVAALNWTHARFHASQLEYLDPPKELHYRVLEAKADLLEALVGRPAALATTTGASAILARVEAVERLDPGALDPDAATARALVLWKQGDTRRDEHEAAALAARALWSNPRGFTLAPMARILVEAYVHAPDPQEGTGPDAALETSAGLAALLALPAPPSAGTPFEGADTLFHLMERLDGDSSSAFIAMIDEQAEVARLQAKTKNAKDPALDAAVIRRNEEASKVVRAWEELDKALRSSSVLADNPLVLQVFRLNDVFLTHALWYTTQPATTEWPKKLSEISSNTLKLAVAPARVTWARRYGPSMQGPARSLVQVQEAQRYEVLEGATIAFEGSYGAYKGAPAPKVAAGAKTKKSNKVKGAADPSLLPADEAKSLKAANDAAVLGLYDKAPPASGQPGARLPLAVKIAGSLDELQKKADDALASLREKTDAKAAAKDKLALNKKLEQTRVDLIKKLTTEISQRVTRLL